MQERLIENNACDRIRIGLGVDSIKLNLQGNRGYPDRLFLLPLRPAWIEFKRPGEKPTPLQYYRLWAMDQLGYDVTWTDNENDAFEWIKTLHTARLSEARNKDHDPTSLRGPVTRSWAGKDFYFSSSNETIVEQTRNQGSSGSGPAEGGL